jgi:hypothetical protein
MSSDEHAWVPLAGAVVPLVRFVSLRGSCRTVERTTRRVSTTRAATARTQLEGPMRYLARDGDRIRLEDGWPAQRDVGRLVLLPGGEAGVLTTWEHAEDHSWWWWSVELFNAT